MPANFNILLNLQGNPTKVINGHFSKDNFFFKRKKQYKKELFIYWFPNWPFTTHTSLTRKTDHIIKVK